MVVGASGQTLQERLDETQNKLSHVRAHAGVLTTRISHESGQLERLTAEVAALRHDEATVATKLARKQAELDQAQARLGHLKLRLGEAIQILEQRLVAIYESNEPDLITVILKSNGFDDLLARTQYVRTLENQDNDIVARVRDLRNEMQATVNTVRATRDEIATRKHGSRRPVDAPAADGRARRRPARAARRAAAGTEPAGRPRGRCLQDLARRSPSSWPRSRRSPGGPDQTGGTRSDLAGQRPGHLRLRDALGQHARGDRHRGAHRDAHPRRGHGDRTHRRSGGWLREYTCIDHGGGLSSCYGHQERILVSVGQQVSQAQVIGITDCTGHCLGPHLHFEVRVNGQGGRSARATDSL